MKLIKTFFIFACLFAAEASYAQSISISDKFANAEFPFTEQKLVSYQVKLHKASTNLSGIYQLWVSTSGITLDSLWVTDITGNPGFKDFLYRGAKISDSSWIFELGDGGLSITDTIANFSFYGSTSDTCGKLELQLYEISFVKVSPYTLIQRPVLLAPVIAIDECGKEKEILSTKQERRKIITVFPNPATDQITIKGYAGPMRIIDMSGRECLNAIVNEAEFQLSIQHLKSGIYLIETQNSTQRFIKQD